MTTYPLNRYINIRWAGSPSFSADSRYLAFLSDITGRFQAWQVELSDDEGFSWPQQLTFSADRVLFMRYAPNAGDNRLLFGHDVGGNEKAQLFIVDAATGEEQCLTEGFEEAMHIPGEWSAQTDKIIFAANRRDPGVFDLYTQKLDGSDAELIWDHGAPGFLWNAVWSPDNKRVAVVRADRAVEREIIEIDLESGALRELSAPDRPAYYMDIAYARDGRHLYAVTNLDSEFLHVARLELAGGSWEKLVTPNAEIEQLAYSADGRYLAYVTNRDGDSYLELIDLATGVARPAPEPSTRPGVIGSYDDHLVFSADSLQLAFSYSSSTRTSDIYVWDFDLDDDALVRKTDSSHGGIPVSEFITPSLIRYPTFDDLQIPAYFYEPQREEGDEPAPAIVIVHGGPESQYRPDFKFLVQYFVGHGYAVLAPNVRGSTGYGKTYMHLDNVEKRMDSVADLAHAAHWLREQPGIDSEKLVVYGGSYGGFMVLSTMTTHPDLWAAGVDVVGISNFVTFLENTSAYRRGVRESEYGSLANDRAFLESVSPINHIDNIVAPLMVVHGANDPRVPLSETEQLVSALQERDIAVKFLLFEDEGHGVAKLKNKLLMYPAVITFLNEVLH